MPGNNFAEVLGEELRAIQDSRRDRRVAIGPDVEADVEAPLNEVRQRAARLELLGLAFSGGGIRSATFNLGVAQALAERRLLRRVDYLSTVSGGGYIGSWLHAFAHREGADGIRAVERKIARTSESKRAENAARGSEAYEIRFLRRFSNYLTPRLGLFGADTWTLISRYVGNLIVTQVVLSAAIVAVMATVLVIASTFRGPLGMGMTIGFFVASNLVLAIGFVSGIRRWPRVRAQAGAAENIQTHLVLPIFGAAFFAALALAGLPLDLWKPLDDPFLLLPVLLAVMSSIMWQFVMQAEGAEAGRGPIIRANLGQRLRAVPSTVFSGVLGGVLLALVVLLYESFPDARADRLIVCVGPPLVCLIFWLTVTLQMAMSGALFSDSNMEWWSRVGAWLLIYCVGWLVFLSLTFFGPDVIEWVAARISAAGGLGAWLVPTVTGLLAANNPSTGGRGASRLLEVVAKIGPYVFFFGLLCSLSWLLHAAAIRNPGLDQLVGIAVATCMLFVLVVQYDVNKYSMHSFYRNRLIRCYLGASTRDRDSDMFTGFADDDLPIARLRASKGAPFAIVNTTLNLCKATDLAWQERKGASFTFTPLATGFSFPATAPQPSEAARAPDEPMRAYRDSAAFGAEGSDTEDGVSLGTCMAISGAAASPNMGYHSSPVLALLLTWFNVRLGAWVGNPLHGPWKWHGPRYGRGITHLVKELFGLTDEKSDFLYLSDGGHFDNLGVYELVRRRCRHILAIDAGADPELRFDDLGNLIRKCRTDLGVHIAIDVEQLRRDAQSGRSTRHCTVGRIYYPRDGDDPAPKGTIVYIKPSLTGDEPADVRNYAARNASFPHQSTGDQFFDESQFESYRKLGRHIAGEVIGCVLPRDENIGAAPSTKDLFEMLRQRWFPQSSAVAQHFSRHGELLEELFEQAREDEHLHFLDWQFYPEWHEVVASKVSPTLPVDPMQNSQWLPETYEQRRAGFYFCNSLIQLMQNVYLDLNFEREWNHPDNRGWVNLFKHWSWSGMFRITWAVSASTYGFRFVAFCERYLDLKVGRDEIEVVGSGTGATPSKQLIDAAQRAEEADRLNFFELYQIKKFVEQHREALDGEKQVELRLLRLHVDDPRKLAVDIRSSGFAFTFGFAIVTGDGPESDRQTAYVRIQDHLRNQRLEERVRSRLPEDARRFDPPEEVAPR